MSIGKKFVSASLADGSVSAFLGHGKISHLFNANEIDIYEFVAQFTKSYGKLPTPDTVEAHTKDVLVPHTEPAAYYHDLMVARYLEKTVKLAAQKALEFLTPENKDPAKALEVMMQMAFEAVALKSTQNVKDFRDAYDEVIGTYAAKFSGEEQPGLMMGWETFDDQTGGLQKGDVLSMVGRPAAGKTWQMLYSAHHGWDRAGQQLLANIAAAGGDMQAPQLAEQSRLFVSMEVNQLAIRQRLASMQTHTPAAQLKLGDLSTIGLKKLKKGLIEIKGYGAPFWVCDANLAANVEDIWSMARYLKPDGIFIDGAYLLAHPTERDRYKRAAENCDLIKRELTPLAPVAASWQFAKTGSKNNKKKGEKANIDDIGYTDAIAQISSLVLGLLQVDNIETLIERLIDILKGRDGQIGSFRTHWNFQQMDFTEIKEVALSELSFL